MQTPQFTGIETWKSTVGEEDNVLAVRGCGWGFSKSTSMRLAVVRAAMTAGKGASSCPVSSGNGDMLPPLSLPLGLSHLLMQLSSDPDTVSASSPESAGQLHPWCCVPSRALSSHVTTYSNPPAWLSCSKAHQAQTQVLCGESCEYRWHIIELQTMQSSCMQHPHIDDWRACQLAHGVEGGSTQAAPHGLADSKGCSACCVWCARQPQHQHLQHYKMLRSCCNACQVADDTPQQGICCKLHLR